jgi:mannose-6-phosphate isomerase
VAQLMARSPEPMLGGLAQRFSRFPLLVKFLDVQKMLSVQVHPRDEETELIPEGNTWQDRSLGRAGDRTADDHLASFAPQRGQAVLIEAGTVHSIGNGVMVFEIQENSDVTFRLYDWDHVDPTTGKKRPLQVEKALACVDFNRPPVRPVPPVIEAAAPVSREQLIKCSHFDLWRLKGTVPFVVGADAAPRVLVCIDGEGNVEHGGADYPMRKGSVVLLPASVGACRYRPTGMVVLLEVGVPDQS